MLSRVILSSRRRHTRWPRDWSSDVCSSDLIDSRARCSPSALNAGAESWYLPEVSARPIGSASSVSEIISRPRCQGVGSDHASHRPRSEEHTSELQSRGHLVCRLLLEKKKYLNS